MIEVAQEEALLLEHFPALSPNPLGPVPHGVDLTLQTPACLPGAVSPTPTRFFHTAEGGPVDRRGTALGPRRHQPHFLPLAGTFARAEAAFHGADHGSIGLGNHMLLTGGRQYPIGLIVMFLQLLLRPEGML